MDLFVQKNREILAEAGYFKIAKKIGLQVISLLFESVSSSIQDFWGASDLLCA